MNLIFFWTKCPLKEEKEKETTTEEEEINPDD